MPLYLTRRARSPYWYIRGAIRGHSICESTGLVEAERQAAEDLLVLRAAELTKRSVHGDAVSRTFPEAALSFMEAGGEGTHLAPLIERFRKRTLASLGQNDVDEACKALKPGAAPATLNRQIIAPFSAVMNHAARKKWCAKPVIARRKEPAGRVRWVTHEEAERLIDAAGHLKPLVVFLFSTGCRLSEALYIDWRQIDLSRCQATFLDTKNGTNRSVPLHPRAVAVLANLPHRKGAVFRRHYGGPRWDGKIRPVGDAYADRGGAGGGQVSTAWKHMLKKAGISDFTPHDCRHTWATWHYAANKDIGELMELGGWKSIAMVERYTHVNVAHLARGQGQIWGSDWTPDGNRSAPETAQPKPLKA